MARYRATEFRLGYTEAGPSYRGFVREDRPYRWLKHWTRGWDKVEPFLPRDEAERFRAHHVGRWMGDALVFADPVTGESVRVEANSDGLYPLRDFGRRPDVVEWVAVFPDWPTGRLDGSVIAGLLDTPLPTGLHPKNRQPVIDRLHDLADVPELVEALRLADTDYARERLAFLLAYHRSPAEAAAAVPLLVDLLETADDSQLRLRYAEAVGELARRAPNAVSPFAARIEAVHTTAPDEPTGAALETALQAIGVHRVDGPFFEQARAALDFLVDEFGFRPPEVVSGPHADAVTYRGPGIAVEASHERRDDYVEVDLVRLDEHGDLPAPLDDEELATVRLPWWTLTATVRPAGRDDLAAAADALRQRPDYLRGDLTQWDVDVRRWREHHST